MARSHDGSQTRVMRWLLAPVASLLAACTFAPARSAGEEYELDAIDRSASANQGNPCHPERLAVYRGTWLRLAPPSAVAAAFAARLERFEVALAQMGHQIYGRGPSQLEHVGTYACRAVEQRTTRLSEHALGNAIDVTALRFPALSAEQSRTSTLPPELRRSFTVSILRDYLPPARSTAVSERHQQFFALLRGELREHELFRGVIGPPDPDHRTHLHLDMAPWPYERL